MYFLASESINERGEKKVILSHSRIEAIWKSLSSPHGYDERRW